MVSNRLSLGEAEQCACQFLLARGHVVDFAFEFARHLVEGLLGVDPHVDVVAGGDGLHGRFVLGDVVIVLGGFLQRLNSAHVAHGDTHHEQVIKDEERRASAVKLQDLLAVLLFKAFVGLVLKVVDEFLFVVHGNHAHENKFFHVAFKLGVGHKSVSGLAEVDTAIGNFLGSVLDFAGGETALFERLHEQVGELDFAVLHDDARVLNGVRDVDAEHGDGILGDEFLHLVFHVATRSGHEQSHHGEQ